MSLISLIDTNTRYYPYRQKMSCDSFLDRDWSTNYGLEMSDLAVGDILHKKTVSGTVYHLIIKVSSSTIRTVRLPCRPCGDIHNIPDNGRVYVMTKYGDCRASYRGAIYQRCS